MKLQNLLLPLSSMLVITSAFADYSVKIPVPTEIRFSNESPSTGEPEAPETPTEPPFDFSEFTGIGTIDSVDSAGYIDSNNIQSMWIQRALFKQYNEHLIYLLGNRVDLMENASSIAITINEDHFTCPIDYKEFISAFNQTIFGCSTNGYNGLNYSAGQKFNIEFK